MNAFCKAKKPYCTCNQLASYLPNFVSFGNNSYAIMHDYTVYITLVNITYGEEKCMLIADFKGNPIY